MTLLATFTDIARHAGFTLPDALAAWYRDGLTGDEDGRAMAAVYDSNGSRQRRLRKPSTNG